MDRNESGKLEGTVRKWRNTNFWYFTCALRYLIIIGNGNPIGVVVQRAASRMAICKRFPKLDEDFSHDLYDVSDGRIFDLQRRLDLISLFKIIIIHLSYGEFTTCDTDPFRI